MHRLFGRILLFQFRQILAHGLLDLGRFRQLFARNPALLGGIGLDETAVHRQVVSLHQSRFQTARYDLFKQLLEQFRFLKTTVPILRERGVMRNLLIEAQPRKPAPCQMHSQFLHQFALAGDAVQIADQQDAQQQFGIDRGTPRIAVAVPSAARARNSKRCAYRSAAAGGFRESDLPAEVVEQRFRAVVLSHHDQQASDDQNQTEHGRMLSSNMLLLNLILLIDVTFSTPTDGMRRPVSERDAISSQRRASRRKEKETGCEKD